MKNETPQTTETPRTEAALATGRHEWMQNVTTLCRELEAALRNVMEAEDKFGHGASMCHPRITRARNAARKIISENAKANVRRDEA